eukprot:EG_transcript_34682
MKFYIKASLKSCLSSPAIMPDRGTHAAQRTTSEWVIWAKADGFDDISENCGDKVQSGKVCEAFFFFVKGAIPALGLLHTIGWDLTVPPSNNVAWGVKLE